MARDCSQLGVLQAYLAAHVPVLAGTDIKADLFLSPQGYETLDPSTTPFYSHSYTYAYGDTFNHTGILTTTHINPTLDLYLGIDTGNRTSLCYYQGDPNGKPAGFVGFGLNNLLAGKLTAPAAWSVFAGQVDVGFSASIMPQDLARQSESPAGRWRGPSSYIVVQGKTVQIISDISA